MQFIVLPLYWDIKGHKPCIGRSTAHSFKMWPTLRKLPQIFNKLMRWGVKLCDNKKSCNNLNFKECVNRRQTYTVDKFKFYWKAKHKLIENNHTKRIWLVLCNKYMINTSFSIPWACAYLFMFQKWFDKKSLQNSFSLTNLQ